MIDLIQTLSTKFTHVVPLIYPNIPKFSFCPTRNTPSLVCIVENFSSYIISTSLNSLCMIYDLITNTV
uniref:Putative ovule protein n=1 Tax=Solanum chacoense TaxID=4108 RepID=A0A0V0IWF5_SOLCH